ncbi:hypothetical protein GCM10008967_03040 [Bacillus carboniphilus]|uniref:Uncharacterized protein n=1 Tax=Bacillus carboniphilus TaxID=86663 RepID=A0ABN0VS16_9BACI
MFQHPYFLEAEVAYRQEKLRPNYQLMIKDHSEFAGKNTDLIKAKTKTCYDPKGSLYYCA